MPLTALDPTWINAPGGVGPSYDAEELRRDLGFLLLGGASAGVSRSGVLDPRALTVTFSGSNVQINAGGAAVGTAKGAYLTGATATATIDALTPADATNPRRDRVVLEILDPDNGGGTGRIAQFRVIAGTPSATAAAGGGYPAAPSSPSITLAHIDVPKSGNGNPAITDLRPFTATAGSPIKVRDKNERDALPKWAYLRAERMDRGGAIDVCNGTTWTEGDSGWTDPSVYGNGFLPYTSGGYDGVKARLVNGWVHISGATVNAGAWAGSLSICQFPAPFRPARREPGVNCVVIPTGDVLITNAGNNTSALVSASFPIG